MDNTAVLTDNGAKVDNQDVSSGGMAEAGQASIDAGLADDADLENNAAPFVADGSGRAPEAPKGPALALRAPDPAGEVSTEISLAGGQMASARFENVPGPEKDTDVPVFLTGSITPPGGVNPPEKSLAFFDANKDVFQMKNPGEELAVKRQTGDEVGMTHVHMSQQYKGVPVFGSDMATHFSPDGKITAVNGRYVPGISLDVQPAISAERAVQAAQQDLGYAASSSTFDWPLLTVLAPAGKPAQLTWKVTLTSNDPPTRMVYFVDAKTAKVAAKYSDLEDAKNRKTYTADNGTSLPGRLLISEGGSSSDSVAQATHNNTGATYDYYYNTFGRDSFNGAGAALISTVHYSADYNNAFWNGQQMVYGDGDGNVFSPLGTGLDVVAHELTHAVTQYTASLVYSYQSGALNESYSDVFGAMVDRDDWLMGEDVYTPRTPGDALRSLSNPAAYGQPDHMNNYVNTDSDNGGVHINSGIPNKAAYNVAQSIGKAKMERIWYRTLTQYLNSGAQFNDARDASVQAATDLYGANGAEVTAVKNGFSAVGIGGTPQSDTTARIEIDHTYRGDLVVTVGVGDPNNPRWSTVVSNRYGGSADNIYATVDIAGGASYLPPNWQNRWFLKVYDAAGYDTGTIRKFTVTDHGRTYAATDVPIAVRDYQTVISYIPTTDTTPPRVTATDPANGGTVYASSNITATFSEAILRASVSATSFRLTRHSDGAAVPAQVSYNATNRTATLDPNAALEYSTVYDATLTTAIRDLAGNPLASNYSWSFSVLPPPKDNYFIWYDYGNANTGLWLFEPAGAGYASRPTWISGPGGWEASRMKTVVGADQNGDGKAELGVLYDYGKATSTLWLFESAGAGYAPRPVWYSGRGNWDWSRSKLAAADVDGDGKSEMTVLYDYGNDNTGLFVFDQNSSYRPWRVWQSGPGNWDWSRSKVTSADVDGDGKTELTILYNYGNGTTGLFVLDPDAAYRPRRAWISGPGAWNWDRSQIFTATDLNRDGRSELAVFYDYGNANAGLWLFQPSGSGYAVRRAWLSGPGGWDLSRSKLTAAPESTDGRLAIVYNYGNSSTGLWLFETSGSAYVPRRVWFSGAGNWDWTRSKTVY